VRHSCCARGRASFGISDERLIEIDRYSMVDVQNAIVIARPRGEVAGYAAEAGQCDAWYEQNRGPNGERRRTARDRLPRGVRRNGSSVAGSSTPMKIRELFRSERLRNEHTTRARSRWRPI